MKRQFNIMQALEWAFLREKAQLVFPDDSAPEDRGFGFGMEYVLIQRAKLGGVRIDTSPGVSDPHIDAETIAGTVAALPEWAGGRRMATIVAEHARTRSAPDWMPDATPRIEPREWARANQHGQQGKTERIGTYIETITTRHPRNPARQIKRNLRHEIRWTPISYRPAPREIERAREAYEKWWEAIDAIRFALSQSRLFDVTITGYMPPRRPWLTQATLADEIQPRTTT